MTPKERAAKQELLRQAMAALKSLATTKGNVLDDKRNRLLQSVIELRRQLSEDAAGTPSDDTTLDEAPPSSRGRGPWSWLKRRWPVKATDDFSLHPVARLLISGICILAWVIQPERTDSSASMLLLMFLRSVPIFIVGGSLCGRARTGTIIGMAIFFVLMWAESLSVVLWDAHLPESSLRMVQHASRLANLLYVLALVGLLLCGGLTLALHRGRWQVSEHYLRMSTQVLAIVQLAIVVELGYTGLRHAIGADQKRIGTIQAIMKLRHDGHWR